MEEQILKQLAQPLLAWYDIHRRILPWREEVSPYRTWVSEIMLQQTLSLIHISEPTRP